jgi:hypothetical protein
MKAVTQHSSGPVRRLSATILPSLLTLLLTTNAAASTQLVLERGSRRDHSGEYTGVVDLAINPGFDGAKVSVSVDGQQVANGLVSPYHLVRPQGRTALYDSIASSIWELRNETNRRAIVVLSDGSDTASNWSFDEIEKLAREAGIPSTSSSMKGATTGSCAISTACASSQPKPAAS